MDRQILIKQNRTKDEIEQFREFYKNVPDEIKQFRKRIQLTQSDVLPSILGDIHEGYSVIILITGRPRSGKTFDCGTIANILSVFLYYEWFNPRKNLHFYPKDFLKNMGDKGYEIRVLEEAGIDDLGKDRWFSDLAELFDRMLQTQQYLININIIVLPFASDLVKRVRKYIDYLCKTEKKGRLKVKKIYKREDQLVSDLKAFKDVTIEEMQIYKTDLPSEIWNEIESMCNAVKMKVMNDIKKGLNREGYDWLGE